MRLARPRARSRPEPGDLVSLAERVGSLSFMRAGFALAVLALGWIEPGLRGVSMGALALATGAYLVPALALPPAVRRLSRGPALLASGAMLLIDGVYLTWVTYATGGVESPLRFLLFVHVVAVTLIASSRTGLKVAAWNSLLLLVVLYAQAAGIIETKETLVSALAGAGRALPSVRNAERGGAVGGGARDRRILLGQRARAPGSEGRPTPAVGDGAGDRCADGRLRYPSNPPG